MAMAIALCVAALSCAKNARVAEVHGLGSRRIRRRQGVLQRERANNKRVRGNRAARQRGTAVSE